MSKALPGWMMYSSAVKQLQKAGFFRTHELLKLVPKRRYQIKPGKRRRKYWYIKAGDFDMLLEATKANHVEAGLSEVDDGTCKECGGSGTRCVPDFQTRGFATKQCGTCHGTGERRRR